MTAETTALEFGRDVNQLNAYAPYPSDLKVFAAMTDGVNGSTVLPTTDIFYIVSFRYTPGAEFWVDVTGAAAVIPDSSTSASTTSEMNPASLKLAGGTNISWITPNTAANISLVIWQTTGPIDPGY